MADWDRRFLDLARHVSTWSKDPSTQVGAVIARPNRTVASLGYNGFPRGVADTPERYGHRETKYRMVVHAEANAILSAGERLDGCALYVTPFFPCSQCAAAIIQAGIERVVVGGDILAPARWAKDFVLAARMFSEAGVEFIRLTLDDSKAA